MNFGNNSIKYFILVFFNLLCISSLYSQIGSATVDINYRFLFPGKNQPPNWRLELSFDSLVSKSDLEKSIVYKVASKQEKILILNYKSITDEREVESLPNERILFVIAPKVAAPENTDCEITINNLKSYDKKKVYNISNIKFRVIPEVNISGIEPFYKTDQDQGITVTFDRYITDTYSLLKQIKFVPRVRDLKMKYLNSSRYGYIYKITGLFKPNKTYTLKTQIPNVEVNTCLRPYSMSFTSACPMTDIEFTTKNSIIELNGRQIIPIYVENCKSIRAEIFSVPAIICSYFASYLNFTKTNHSNEKNKYQLDNKSNELEDTLEISKNTIINLNQQKENLASSVWCNLFGNMDINSEVFFPSSSIERISLPLSFRKNNTEGGMFILKLNEIDSNLSIIKVIQITDLSITYKFSVNKLLIWVTSISNGMPIENVDVYARSVEGKFYYIGKTNKDGICLAVAQNYPTLFLQNNSIITSENKLKIEDIYAVLVYKSIPNKDFLYLPLDTSRYIPEGVKQGLPKTKSAVECKAHIFTERGVYRPSETVYWKVTARKFENGEIKALKNAILRIVIKDSKYNEIFSQEFNTNDFGTCAGSYQLSPNSPLGEYNIYVYYDPQKQPKTNETLYKDVENWKHLVNNELTTSMHQNVTETSFIANTSFNVQFFEAPRHLVQINFKESEVVDEMIINKNNNYKIVKAVISANYYGGGKLKFGKCSYVVKLVAKQRSYKEYPEFTFGNNDENYLVIESGNGLLDSNGILEVNVPLDKRVLGGLYAIEFSATVLDVDNKPATKVEVYEYKPKYEVGIRVGQKNKMLDRFVEVLVLDKNLQPIPKGRIILDIYVLKTLYSYKSDSMDDYSTSCENVWIKMLYTTKDLENGKARFDVVLDQNEPYLIQATYEAEDTDDATKYVSHYIFRNEAFYFYSYESYSLEKDKREVVLDVYPAVIQPNKSVDVRCSFDRYIQKALLTVEIDDILDYKIVDVRGNELLASISIPYTTNPNAYINVVAQAVREDINLYSNQKDLSLPTAYFGCKEVKLIPNYIVPNIEIEAENKEISNKELLAEIGEELAFKIKIISDKNSSNSNAKKYELAVAVVDEAVLALTNYVTPKLSSLLNFQNILSVFTGDSKLSLISQELYKFIRIRPLTGGDAGDGTLISDLALRKDFRFVPYWNPALITNNDGIATFSFKLPDTITKYRLYVIAQDDSTEFASKDIFIKAYKQFYIQPSVPTFLVEGDIAQTNVNVHNYTDKDSVAKVKILEKNNIETRLDKESIEIEKYSNKPIGLELFVPQFANNAKIKFYSNLDNNLHDAIEANIEIKPKFYIIKKYISGSFLNNTSIDISLPKELNDLSSDILEKTVKANIELSITPIVKLKPMLMKLISYPYGCVEQVSSRLLSLVAIKKYLDKIKDFSYSKDDINKYIDAGIAKLQSMQIENGAFSYWSGSSYPSWWGTQYALFALLLAKEAGFSVDVSVINNGINYVNNNIIDNFRHETDVNNYFALVNLALAKKINKEFIDYLDKYINSDRVADKIILAKINALKLWAYALVNKTSNIKDQYKNLIRKINEINLYDYQTSWECSDIRVLATHLLSGLEIDPMNEKNHDILNQLFKRISNNINYLSTMDMGWAILAITKYMDKFPNVVESQATATICLEIGNSKNYINLSANTVFHTLNTNDLLRHKKLLLSIDSNNHVSYTLEITYPYLEYDKQTKLDRLDSFIIKKKIINLHGSSDIKTGDVLKVEIEIEPNPEVFKKKYNLKYVVLEDPLPAGFRPINTALKIDLIPEHNYDESTQKLSSYEDNVNQVEGNEEEAMNNQNEKDEEDDKNYYYSYMGEYEHPPNHFEMHQDKVIAFYNYLPNEKVKFSYFVRAIYAGTFTALPTSVSLMYEPKFVGLSNLSKVTILPDIQK